MRSGSDPALFLCASRDDVGPHAQHRPIRSDHHHTAAPDATPGGLNGDLVIRVGDRGRPRAAQGAEVSSDRGFMVVINRQQQKVLISFDAGSVDPRHRDWLTSVGKREAGRVRRA